MVAEDLYESEESIASEPAEFQDEPLAGDWRARTESAHGTATSARRINPHRPRNRSYAWMGAVVLVCLAAAVLMGFAGIPGPGIFHQDVAWVIGVCLLALAVGLLYVLFTIRVAMRHLREQALILARVERERTDAWEWTYPSPTPAPAPAGQSAPPIPNVTRYSRPVVVVEGIGPTYSRRLRRIGVTTLDDLRRADPTAVEDAVQARTPVARDWKAMADLMILDGVHAQAAELLVRAGCTSLDDLATRDPAELHRTLRRINEANAVRIHPATLHVKDVERWVNAARRNERRDLAFQNPDWSSSPVPM
ncbi:MAG: DUF4332 domain-containing protein [bacterium]